MSAMPPSPLNFTAFKTTHPGVQAWVDEMKALCQPDAIHWCDGSEEEKERLTQQAVEAGVLIKLNQEKLPGCYYHRSNPNDVARVRNARSSAPERRTPPDRPTTGWLPPRCTKNFTAFARAR